LHIHKFHDLHNSPDIARVLRSSGLWLTWR